MWHKAESTPPIEIYTSLIEKDLEGYPVIRMIRKYEPHFYTIFWTRILEDIYSDPNFHERGLMNGISYLSPKQIKSFKLWEEWDENRLTFVQSVQKALLVKGSIKEKHYLNIFFNTSRLTLQLLWKKLGMIEMLDIASSMDETQSNILFAPLPIFAESLKREAERLFSEYKYLQIKNEEYLRITDDTVQFKADKEYIDRFLLSSLASLEKYKNDVLSLSRRPYTALTILKRISHELTSITHERQELKWNIVRYVKESKSKSKKIEPISMQHSQEIVDKKITKAKNTLYLLTDRLNTIAWNIQTARWWWGIILRMASSILKQKIEYTEECEKIRAEIKAIGDRYGEFQEWVWFLNETIDSLEWLLSAKLETRVSQEVERITLSEWKENTREKENEWSERDFLAADIIRTYLMRTACSSTNTKWASVADGNVYYQILLPFLNYCINKLRKGEINSDTMNLKTCFQEYKASIVPTIMNNKIHTLQGIESAFEVCEIWSFYEVFPSLIYVIKNISETLARKNWHIRGNTPCKILVDKSSSFFESHEWKGMQKRLSQNHTI